MSEIQEHFFDDHIQSARQPINVINHQQDKPGCGDQ
jgi:hypothetical protein